MYEGTESQSVIFINYNEEWKVVGNDWSVDEEMSLEFIISPNPGEDRSQIFFSFHLVD